MFNHVKARPRSRHYDRLLPPRSLSQVAQSDSAAQTPACYASSKSRYVPNARIRRGPALSHEGSLSPPSPEHCDQPAQLVIGDAFHPYDLVARGLAAHDAHAPRGHACAAGNEAAQRGVGRAFDRRRREADEHTALALTRDLVAPRSRDHAHGDLSHAESVWPCAGRRPPTERTLAACGDDLMRLSAAPALSGCRGGPFCAQCLGDDGLAGRSVVAASERPAKTGDASITKCGEFGARSAWPRSGRRAQRGGQLHREQISGAPVDFSFARSKPLRAAEPNAADSALELLVYANPGTLVEAVALVWPDRHRIDDGGLLRRSDGTWLLRGSPPEEFRGAPLEPGRRPRRRSAPLAPQRASSGVAGSDVWTPRSRRATPLSTAAFATASATDSATRRLNTLGMM